MTDNGITSAFGCPAQNSRIADVGILLWFALPQIGLLPCTQAQTALPMQRHITARVPAGKDQEVLAALRARGEKAAVPTLTGSRTQSAITTDPVAIVAMISPPRSSLLVPNSREPVPSRKRRGQTFPGSL